VVPGQESSVVEIGLGEKKRTGATTADLGSVESNHRTHFQRVEGPFDQRLRRSAEPLPAHDVSRFQPRRDAGRAGTDGGIREVGGKLGVNSRLAVCFQGLIELVNIRKTTNGLN
jgi:hypothetical protein